MTFSYPAALLLLLTLPYFIWLGRPRRSLRRWRDWSSLVVRVLLLLLLVLSAAGAQWVRAADEMAVVFLVDASDSINSAQAEQAETYVREALATMTPTDQAAVIVFGGNALVERPMSGLTELAPVRSTPLQLQTDIGEAIRLALALFPAGKGRRIVILSDGASTVDSTSEAARLAGLAGVEISYVPLLRTSAETEAYLTSVSAPTRISQGEIFRIDIAAESNTNMPAILRVLSGGIVIYEESVSLNEGTNNFAVRLRAIEQEFARYRVELTPQQDTYYQNNELEAFTEVIGPPRVLLVANDGTLTDDGAPQPDESPQLLLALTATGIEVERITPAELPASLAQLSNYASVVLVNVNAKNISPRKMEVLQSYVRDLGGGLVVVGGPQSYGMGGYYKTPLEETLPVDMQIKDQERFPGVSMVIVIDRSGSMGANEGGVTKIQLAAEGAVRVVELLNDFDEITVIPVDTRPDNPIGPLPASDKATAIQLIRQIGAGGGGIYVRTGLEAAAAALAGSPNQIKHIILLADGADSEQKEGVPQLIEGLVAENVTLTAVSIGNGPDVSWLQEMAELGNGRFHFTDQAANLPQIFTQETTSIQRSYLVEERFFPALVSSSPILAGISAVPPLYGYVGTSPKATAQVILKTHQDDPLLAAWQYGLGRAVAWTSDATGRWGTDWVQWEGFPAFWAQTVRWTISQDRESNIETTITYAEEDATLTVDARDGNGAFLNNLTLEANVVAPDGTVNNLTLSQVAPGRYAAAFTPATDGAYFIRVAGSENTGDEEAAIGQTSGWILGYSPEYRQFEPQPEELAALAQITGGRDVSTDISAIFDHNLATEAALQPIWQWLTMAAVLLLPLDIALRRLVITRRDWERAWAATLGRYFAPSAPVPDRSDQVSRLFAAKKRAGTTGRAEVEAEAPLPIQRQDAVETAVTPPEKPVQPAPPEKSATKPAAPPGSLAARLLEKKRNQQS